MGGYSDVQKTIAISAQAAKMTKELFTELLKTFLENPPKRGQIKYSDMLKKGKLESIEVTENNIGDFLQTARKYDIDYALKKDSSTSPPTYHVFFQSSAAENFRKAFSEYAKGAADKSSEKTASRVINREQIKQSAKIISQKSAEKAQEKHLNKSDIGGR